jgi:type II secretory pathway pseudopilin PulG
LVVIVILTTLVAAAIPILAPATGERRIREGARQLNTTITAAQARAIELGRPVGIYLERQSVETNRPEDRGAVTTVYYAEEPVPFRGFSPDSAAILHPVFGQLVVEFVRDRIDPVNSASTYFRESLPPGMIRQYDRLEVGGVMFRLVDGDPNKMETTGPFRGYYKALNPPQPLICERLSGDFNPNLTFASPHSTPPNGWTYPKPYTIHRQPVRSSSDPLQLPDGIVVDLEGSGDHSGLGGFFHDPIRPYPDTPPVPNNNDEPVVIMFGADGTLNRVYRKAGLPPPVNLTATDPSFPLDYIPQSSIHLLVARRENVNESASVSATTAFSDDNRANWFNKQSLWVSINPRTGRVATNENTPVDETFFDPNSAAYGTTWPLLYKQFVFQRYAAREFARDSQTLGGR